MDGKTVARITEVLNKLRDSGELTIRNSLASPSMKVVLQRYVWDVSMYMEGYDILAPENIKHIPTFWFASLETSLATLFTLNKRRNLLKLVWQPFDKEAFDDFSDPDMVIKMRESTSRLIGYHNYAKESFQRGWLDACYDARITFSLKTREEYKDKLLETSVSDLTMWLRTYPLVFNYLSWCSNEFPTMADLYCLQILVLHRDYIFAYSNYDFEKTGRRPRFNGMEMTDNPIKRQCLVHLTAFCKSRFSIIMEDIVNHSEEVRV
jgi:hypothetical protein